MDNASNALIMAGEMLIAVLVISLMVYVNVMFGSFSASVNERIALSRDREFNSRFTNYTNRTNISASEIATIINFAKQANDRNGYDRIKDSDRTTVLGRAAKSYVNVYIYELNSSGRISNTGYSFFGSNRYMTSDEVYSNDVLFTDAVNRFIKEAGTTAYCCNCELTLPTYPTGEKPLIKIRQFMETDSQYAVTYNGNRANSIIFYKVPVDRFYDLTNFNDFQYQIRN